MDIPRATSVKRRKLIKQITLIVFGLGLVLLTTLGLSRLKPAAPTVERSTVWLDGVKRGPMIRQVRGLGVLVPEEVLWVPALSEGRVERILIRPGTEVKADSVLLILGNPELELQALEADYQVKAAEAEYANLKIQLESARLNQTADLARVGSDYHQSKLKADRDELLAKEGLLADLSLQLSKSTATELSHRREIEEKRLDIQSQANEAQLAAKRAEIDKLKALAALRKNDVGSLHVRAGAAGVLQQMEVEVGQRVPPGSILAKVAQPEHLKAELKIPETQAKDVALGQIVSIDTRNGLIPGTVSRVDPVVKEGTVTVDIRLTGNLPPGARPDLSVEGIIEIERLPDVIYVGRPAFGQPNSTVSMFRLEADGVHAARTQVKLGRSSVSTIEIIEGLQPGDQVILSDSNAWDDHDRIQLR